MVDRKHSLHIRGNLITTGNITYCVPTWGQGEREREREGEREGEGEGKRQREWERRREGETQIKNTSQVLAIAQLQVYARGFQLVLSPAWRARLVFSFGVSCFNTGSFSDVYW